MDRDMIYIFYYSTVFFFLYQPVKANYKYMINVSDKPTFS